MIGGDDTELDRVILEGLSEPLVHLVRNAVAHGIETPDEREARRQARRARRVELARRAARRHRSRSSSPTTAAASRPASLARGPPAAARSPTCSPEPGFSTAAEVTELSGRGVGLDAVKRHVEGFGGTLEVRSEPGRGTADRPRASARARAARRAARRARRQTSTALPLASVEEAVAAEDLLTLEGRPVARAPRPLGAARRPRRPDRRDGAAARRRARRRSSSSAGGRRVAATCDRLLGQEEVVVKPLGPLLASASRLPRRGDPRRRPRRAAARPLVARRGAERRQAAARAGARSARERLAPKILVVEDSFTVRELQRSILEAAGYRVETARDGSEGLDRVSARRRDRPRDHRPRDAGDGRPRADAGDPRAQRATRRCPS